MFKENEVRVIIESHNMATVEVYDTLTGKFKFVNVSLEVADCLVETQREIWRIDKEIERNTYSLDSALYEGSDFGREDDYFEPTEDEQLTYDEELAKKEAAAWDSLTEIQHRRVKLYQANGHNASAIARSEGVREQCVCESIKAARKKMEKILNQTP